MRWKLLVAAVATSAVVAVAWAKWAGPTVTVTEVKRKALHHTIVASGRIETPERFAVASTLLGRAAEVRVDEGDVVKSGDLLVVLEAADLTAAVQQAQANLSLVQAKFERLGKVAVPLAQEALNQAEVNLKQAERQNRNVLKLSKEKNVSQDQIDTAGEALALRRSQVQTAQLQLKSLQPGGQDYQQADAELMQAKAALELAQAKLSFSKIVAPRPGLILQRKVEPGQVVQASGVMFVMVPTDHPEISLPIDEKNLSFVRAGQVAKVTADAFPGEYFDAHVKKVAPSVDAERGAVDVTLSVDNPPSFLREDMTVSAEVIVANKDSALLVGSAAVREADSVAPWVWRVKNNSIEKVHIKIGARESGYTEVLEGLSENEVVVAGTTEPLNAGERVRTQEVAP